jgi:hypothetical protein
MEDGLVSHSDQCYSFCFQAMAKEISNPQNSAITKSALLRLAFVGAAHHVLLIAVTVDNLAIVFAPGLMRNPSQDPIEVLQNTKFESRFISLLFTVGRVCFHCAF